MTFDVKFKASLKSSEVEINKIHDKLSFQKSQSNIPQKIEKLGIFVGLLSKLMEVLKNGWIQ